MRPGVRTAFDYQIDSYRESDLVKVSILVNNEPVDLPRLVQVI